jgi:carbamate kinase
MDGLSATLLLLGHRITFTYSVKGSTHGPGAIVVNGQQVPFVREQNHYRTGGAVIEKDKLKSLFNKKKNTIVITL